jgi:hypothetical protein
MTAVLAAVALLAAAPCSAQEEALLAETAAPAVHDEAAFCAFTQGGVLMFDEANPISAAQPRFTLSDKMEVTGMTADCATRHIDIDIAADHVQGVDENGVDGPRHVNGDVCAEASPMKGAIDSGWVMVAQATFTDAAQEMTIDCKNLSPIAPPVTPTAQEQDTGLEQKTTNPTTTEPQRPE